MSDSTTAKIFAAVNDGQYSAEGIRMEMDVNNFPTARITLMPSSSEEVRSPVSAETIDRIAQLQAARLAGRTEPDLEITADDGTGGQMSFSGFTSAPVLELTRNHTIDQITGVGKDALLDALDLSIYSAGYVALRKEKGSTTETQLKPIPATKDGDVIGAIKDITDVLVSNVDQSIIRESLALSKLLVESRHALNESAPLGLWTEILENSDVQYESWKEATKRTTIARLLAETIKKILTSNTPGFWNVVRQLMATFQMHYVPSFDGSGRFDRSDKKVADPETSMEVSISGLSLADGNPRILQPGGVVMMGAESPPLRREGAAIPQKGRVVAFYPNPLLPGFIQEEVPPFWLVREGGVPIFGSEVDKSTSQNAGKKIYDLNRYKKDREVVFKDREKLNVESSGVLTEMCEIIFKELQLAHSTAVLTMPLNFKVNGDIGKRATINILGEGGKPSGSFTAFISGVTHAVDLRMGKELNSSTQVRCTHVKYGS